MDKQCEKCGAEVYDDAKFCPMCGGSDFSAKDVNKTTVLSESENRYEAQRPVSERNPGSRQNPYAGAQQNPYAGAQQNPYAGAQQNPYAGAQQNPYTGAQQNPYGGAQQNPYGGAQQNPYAGAQQNPYGGAQQNPYGSSQQNPYGGTHSQAPQTFGKAVSKKEYIKEYMPRSLLKQIYIIGGILALIICANMGVCIVSNSYAGILICLAMVIPLVIMMVTKNIIPAIILLCMSILIVTINFVSSAMAGDVNIGGYLIVAISVGALKACGDINKGYKRFLSEQAAQRQGM